MSHNYVWISHDKSLSFYFGCKISAYKTQDHEYKYEKTIILFEVNDIKYTVY